MNRLAWLPLLFLFVPRAGLAQTTWLPVPWVELGGEAQLIARVIVNTPALYQALGFEDQRPPQLVVGTGGTALNMAINDPVHAAVGGTRIVSSETQEVFGYLLLTKTAERWTATLRTARDHTVVRCAIAEGRINCQTPREPAS